MLFMGTMVTNGVSFSLVNGAILALRFTTSAGYKTQFSISTLNVNSTGAKNVSYMYSLYNANRTGNGFTDRWTYNLVGYANNEYFNLWSVYNYPDYTDGD